MKIPPAFLAIATTTTLLLLGGCASASVTSGAASSGGQSSGAQSLGPLNQLTVAEQEAHWMRLFDGETLNGWTNRGTAQWHVQDGAITVTPGTGPGHLATNQKFSDFRLELDFYAGDGANSGVYLRAPVDEPATVDNSYEVQIFDEGPEWQTGAVIQVQALKVRPNTVNRWNHFAITLIGAHFTVALNGETVVDAAGPPRREDGVIILAPAQGELRFRNIRIQPLSCFGCAHPSTYD